MLNNLSRSETFRNTWLINFNKGNTTLKFDLIKGITFIKSKYFPIYKSLGGSAFMTSNFYEEGNSNTISSKNKVCIVYNLPSYYTVKPFQNVNMKLHKVNEYEGYLADFSKHLNINDYFKEQLGSNNFRNIKRRQRKLDKCFNISCKLFYGSNISKEQYDVLLKQFRELLIKKFKAKKEHYNHTSDDIWKFYYELIYPMIIKKEASLFVVFNGEEAISIILSYHFDSVVTGVITVFDLDYSKFSLGSIAIIKLFETIFEMGFKKYDLYKGGYGYKKNWSNQIYNYEHHILYDNSFLSRSIAIMLSNFFKLKQYLRQKGFKDYYCKILFFIKNRGVKNTWAFELSEISDSEVQITNIESINLLDEEYVYLKRVVYDFIYATNEFIGDIKLYKVKGMKNNFILTTKTKNFNMISKE